MLVSSPQPDSPSEPDPLSLIKGEGDPESPAVARPADLVDDLRGSSPRDLREGFRLPQPDTLGFGAAC
jgi:hypothetical protein